LYGRNRIVCDLDIRLKWIGEIEKRNETPVFLEFCFSDGGTTSSSKKLNCFINLPGSHTPRPDVLSPAVEKKLTMLLNDINGEENARGWFALGIELGMTRDQLETLKKEPHPTSCILSDFFRRGGETHELLHALWHLGHELTTFSN
jgi:hypothetical protein